MDSTLRLFAILAGIVLIMWGVGFDAKGILEFLFPEAARETRREEAQEAERKAAETQPDEGAADVGEARRLVHRPRKPL